MHWLTSLNHPNLVRFCAVCLERPLVVMEFYKVCAGIRQSLQPCYPTCTAVVQAAPLAAVFLTTAEVAAAAWLCLCFQQ